METRIKIFVDDSLGSLEERSNRWIRENSPEVLFINYQAAGPRATGHVLIITYK